MIENVNKINISSFATNVNHGYNAPNDGIIIICFAITNNCDCYININNISIARIRWQSGAVNATNVFPITIPIAKGNNLTISNLSSYVGVANGYFIPYYK